MCIMKAWELAPPTLPSISSRAPHETHSPAPQQDHDELDDVPTSLSGVAAGDLGHPRAHLVQEDSSQLETWPRVTCHVMSLCDGAHRGRLAAKC